MEPYQFTGDDTGLNSIALVCSDPNGAHVGTTITSGKGTWGDWKGRVTCNQYPSNPTFLVAYSLEVESPVSNLWQSQSTLILGHILGGNMNRSNYRRWNVLASAYKKYVNLIYIKYSQFSSRVFVHYTKHCFLLFFSVTTGSAFHSFCFAKRQKFAHPQNKTKQNKNNRQTKIKTKDQLNGLTNVWPCQQTCYHSLWN